MWRWIILVLCWCAMPSNARMRSLPPSAVPCFFSCVCDTSDTISCSATRTFTEHVNKFNIYLLKRGLEGRVAVHIQTENKSLPEFLPQLPMLRYLDLAENNLEFIQGTVLKGMRLRELNLSRNQIRRIDDEAFHDLIYLQVLDLSDNRLSSVSKPVFADLPNLRVLNLDFNSLLYFPFDAFSRVPWLEVLSLNHNMLSYLSPGSLMGLSSLHSLALHNNSLWSVAVMVKVEAPSVKVVDISHNPFHCSCSTAGLRSIVNSTDLVLRDPDDVRCSTPLGFRGQRVKDAMTSLHACRKPRSMLSHDSQTVFYTDDIQLSCDIQGDPDPAILWMTPWGEQFADPLHLPRLESVCEMCHRQRHYESNAMSLESTVTVNQGGKSLQITNFRGMFRGNITCLAFNYLGNDSSVHTVRIISGIPATFISSLYAAAFSAGGFLCFGLLVGSVKLIVHSCRARFGKRRKVVRTPTTTTAILSNLEDCDTVFGSHCRDNYFSDDFDTPPSSPLISPLISPSTIVTPEEGEGTPTDAYRQSNILESMEEVRWRLRNGVGQKMKTVKRNVQSIRETGRRNVQSIRDSGSTAASKVKAGMVMGMETMKCHVQSIKEFCGTGDMGTHTISTISVETNLDTNETTEIVKSVTIV